MTTAEIRQAFLDYFNSKGHESVSSSSLIPAGDPTLLFCNAGMVQFKDTFLGAEKRGYSRASSCQKCLRISGKHNDLENVGRTARHHTFFEMLGNFSFGDYFKEEAIKFAWEFITETMALSKDRLWVTVYQDDDEAEKLWSKNTDILPGRILRFGEKDNFWAMGDTGPCGPCSEIFYYLGDDLENQSEEEFRNSESLYIEIWNLVFMQFNRLPSGELEALPKPSVDTGMGLERIAAVKQGVLSNYDTDTFRAIIGKTEELSGRKYNGSDYTERSISEDTQYANDVAFRVIADHLRATAFLISDGINPSSDGRGYVVRRLLRRACRYGKLLGFKQAFIYELVDCLTELMSDVYPELKKNKAKIEKAIRTEEERFLETLGTGLSLLEKETDQLKKKGTKVLSGELAFLLHDTYGFPLDMTEDIASGLGLSVDRDSFSTEMDKQRERSRSARASSTQLVLKRSIKPVKTEFVGYSFDEYESKVIGLFNEEGELDSAKQGDEIAIVCEETPFYAESGGQVGDTGEISSNSASLEVIDTQKVGTDTIVQISRVVEGEITKGDAVRLAIEEQRRKRLRINHSATHLLHLALREVLGEHVKQAGSRVSDRNLRFDFSHSEPLTEGQLREIEAIANAEVQANAEVLTEVQPIDEAKKSGAVALFGEKYGDLVRVVQIGERSRELCGGTHSARAGDIGLISIFSESSVSSGVRRIEAYAGITATTELAEQKTAFSELCNLLNTNQTELVERVKILLQKNKQFEKDLGKLQQSANASLSNDLITEAKTLASGIKVITSVLDQASPKQLREMADDLRSRLGTGCIALASVNDGKAILLTAVTEDLTKTHHAGNLVSELAQVMGSRGGGRADLAQAGGGDPEKIAQAFARFEEILGSRS